MPGDVTLTFPLLPRNTTLLLHSMCVVCKCSLVVVIVPQSISKQREPRDDTEADGSRDRDAKVDLGDLLIIRSRPAAAAAAAPAAKAFPPAATALPAAIAVAAQPGPEAVLPVQGQ